MLSPLLAPMPATALTPASKSCNIVLIDLAVTGDRLMIKCDSPAAAPGGASIEFFAIHLGKNLEHGKMALSLMTAAKVAGRQVRVHYVSDATSTTQWDMSCNPKDCRPISRLMLE
jgi:hypothetical protein